MDSVFAIPPIWLPDGKHQRLIGLSSVKSITFDSGQHGVYIQAFDQNVYITLDGTTPVATGNITGFLLRSTDPAVLFTGRPGMTIKIIQAAASAVVQYQMLKLADKFL